MTREETIDTNTTILIRSSSEAKFAANLFGQVNTKPGLKVNQSINCSCSLRLFKLKPE